MEIWKNIEGFPGYQVSNLGRVRSFWKGIARNAHISTEWKLLAVAIVGTKSKYPGVHLYSSGYRRVLYIHRLVWEAFRGDIPEGLVLDHINRNRMDPTLENLRLCTRDQNARNSSKTPGKASQYKGVRWHNRSRSWKPEIIYKGKVYSLGYFKDEVEAAKRRDHALREILSPEDLEFCQFNFEQLI